MLGEVRMLAMTHSLARFAREVDDEIVWLEDSPPLALEALFSHNLVGFSKKIKEA